MEQSLTGSPSCYSFTQICALLLQATVHSEVQTTRAHNAVNSHGDHRENIRSACATTPRLQEAAAQQRVRTNKVIGRHIDYIAAHLSSKRA
jgi:hypothetical protein